MAEGRDIIVIGAGAAGLACAERLREAGLDFLVLEAANRIGGRIQTNFELGGGRPFEVGALMVHGRHVITHRWIDEAALHARPLPTLSRARFRVNGRLERLPVPRNLLHRTIGFRAFYQGAVALPRRLLAYEGRDLSLADWLEGERALPGAKLLVDLLYAHASAADADALGVKGPASESLLASEEFGYHNFQVVEGYDSLIERRSAPIRDRIRLQTRVTSVLRWSGGVDIETRGPDGEEREIRAKRAVITLPLGVLKSDTVAFDPPLPEAKRAAIRAIGFGDAMVVLLKLRGSNLAHRLGDFGLLWGGGATSFHRPYVATQSPPDILDGFVVGREAQRRAALPDREVLDLTLGELRDLVPSSIPIGEVEGFAASRWPVHPFVRGGYSFLPPGGTNEHRRELAAPVDGLLFFAGEATHTEGEAATVHGAIETGYRAAAEVIASLREH